MLLLLQYIHNKNNIFSAGLDMHADISQYVDIYFSGFICTHTPIQGHSPSGLHLGLPGVQEGPDSARREGEVYSHRIRPHLWEGVGLSQNRCRLSGQCKHVHTL